MRTRIDKYTIVGERQIKLETPITIEDVRLIVNETKKIVICSSMQKDNITIVDGVIEYANNLPESEFTDMFTIEVDRGSVDSTTFMPCDRSAIDEYFDNLPTKEE